MLNPPTIEELRRRLEELGVPPRVLRRIVQETAEHFQDLREAAMARGLPEAEAARLAEEQLGDPVKLAEQHAAEWRKASGEQSHYGWRGVALAGLVAVPLVSVVGCTFYTALTAWAAFALARRAGASFKCIWMVCAVTLLEAICLRSVVSNMAMPLLMAGMMLADEQTRRNHVRNENVLMG